MVYNITSVRLHTFVYNLDFPNLCTVPITSVHLYNSVLIVV